MAKRTKFKNDNVNANNNNTALDESSNSSDSLLISANNNINTPISSVSDIKSDNINIVEEYEHGKIIELNIIHKDDYVKFIELAIKYNLFNNIEDLNRLHKNDLCALIGLIINTLYIKEIELEQYKATLDEMKNKEIAKTQTSFDKPVNYSDLFGNLNIYKAWN